MRTTVDPNSVPLPALTVQRMDAGAPSHVGRLWRISLDGLLSRPFRPGLRACIPWSDMEFESCTVATTRRTAMRSRLMHWMSFGSLALAALFTLACAPAQARRGTPPANALRSDIADLCGGLQSELSFLGTGRVEQALVLSEDQSAKFTSLKEASEKAHQHLRDNCPTDNPVTPTARAAATEQQL